MSNAAYKLTAGQPTSQPRPKRGAPLERPSHHVGFVDAVKETEITVRTDRGGLVAERAASCLLAPAPGDEVAVFDAGDGRVFVTAVLVRDEARSAEIAVPGDLRISAKGTCRIEGGDAVEVSSEGGRVSLTSKALLLRAVEGSVVLSKLTMLASSVLAHAEGVEIASKALDWFCERFSSTVKTSYRKVEELDQLRASRIDYRTENEMSLRAENFLVGVQQLVKVDAEQIHLG